MNADNHGNGMIVRMFKNNPADLTRLNILYRRNVNLIMDFADDSDNGKKK